MKILKFIIVIIASFFLNTLNCQVFNSSKNEHKCLKMRKKDYKYSAEDKNSFADCLKLYYHQSNNKAIAEIIKNIKPHIKPSTKEMATINAYEACIYIYLRNPTEAEKKTKESLKIISGLKNSDEKVALTLLNMLFINNINEVRGVKTDDIINYTKKILALASNLDSSSYNYNYYTARAANTLAMLYLSKDLNESKKYLLVSQKSVSAINEPYTSVRLYKALGAYNEKLGRDKDALNFYMQAVDMAKENQINSELYFITPMISNIYSKMGDWEKSTKYANRYKILTDSINKVKVETSDFIEKNNLNDETDYQKYLPLLIVLPLIILGLFALLKTKKEKKSPEEVLLKKEVTSDDLKELASLAKENEDAFYLKFPKIYPAFYKNLNNLSPQLSSSEIKFIMYLILKFSTKEIAQYTNTTVKAVENKKYRLRKKLNLPSDKDIYLAIEDLQNADNQN